MQMLSIQIISLIVNLIFFGVIIYSVYKSKLSEAYAIIWLAVGIVMIVFSASAPLLSFVARLLQIKTPIFALLAFLIMGMLMMLFQLTIVISVHNHKLNRLVEEIALLREQIERKK